MDRRSLPLNALRAFEAVAKHGSFTAAATALFVSQSALSRHVLALEAQIGKQLFERRHHTLVLTEAGRLLLPAVQKSFDRLELALADISDDRAVRRVLRVQMPPSFAANLAVPILRDFRRACPDVAIDVVSPHGGTASSEVDVAVVYARPMVSDAVTDLLWEPRPTILCHPSLLVGDSAADPAALIRANEILHVRIEDTPRYGTWSQFATQNAIAGVDVERGLVFDTANLAAQYAMSGEGIALLDPLLYAEEIRAGRLAAPFSATVDHGFGYFLITQPDDLGDVAIATFRSWLIQRFGGSDAARERQAVRLVHSVG